MNEPIKRDWLKEAYEIAHGTYKGKNIKREHIQAVLAQVKSFENSFAILESKMKDLFDRECVKRKAAGLPPPPTPPSFNPQVAR